ncbi:hypothetical protein [Siminovitchia terrae]|nr:hypothetical protein [Siminovitchia terrae]
MPSGSVFWQSRSYLTSFSRSSIQWGFKPRLNKVKASGGCHRFSEEIYRD